MGCTGKDQAVEITAQMVSDFALSIEIAEKKCKLIIKKRAETMKKKDDEIYAALKQRNLDLSLQRMESYLKDENYISALLILKNIFDNIKVKSALMVSSKECPVSLRPPLDSIIYASTRLKLEELNDLIDKIKQMYGENYINKAKNNEDEIVNQILVTKLNGGNISKETVKERLSKFIKEKQAQRKSAIGLSIGQSNQSNNSQKQSTQKQPPKTDNNNNKVNNVNNIKPSQKKQEEDEDDIFGKTVVATVAKSKKEENKENKKPENPSTTNNNNTNNNTNQVPPGSINLDMLANLNFNDDAYDFLGGTTTKTINNLNGQNDGPLPNEDNIIDILGGETCQTMHVSVANPDNKENPFEGNINDIMASDDPLGGPTLPVEEIPIKKEEGKDPFDKNNQVDDPFGGKTIQEEEENKPKEGKDPFDKNNKIDDPFGGETIKEEEENNKQGEGPDPFDKNAKIADPFGGPTL